MSNYVQKYDTADLNLIDLKGDDDGGVEEAKLQEDYVDDLGGVEEDQQPTVLDFSQLKLIENPIGEMSRDALPQTLHGCVGYMEELPLLQPNADQSDPESIVEMVNSTLIMPGGGNGTSNRSSGGGNNDVIVSNHGDMMVTASCRKKTIHSKAFSAMGHTVRPGCISLYKKYETIYAVPEGRWWLLDPIAKWMTNCKNISLDKDYIHTEDNQVLIIRIIEGQVGLITIQGVHYLLDVGTHVFNTGTVQFVGAVTYSDKVYFSHGPYHYLNVPRGKNAKVWVEVIGTDGD